MYCAVCEVLRSVLLHAFATLFLWKCMQFQRRTLSNRISSLLWSFLSLYPQGVCKECAGFSLQKHSSRRITSSKLQKEDLLKKETPFAEISGCFFFFFFSFKRDVLLCFYSTHFYCQNDENQPLRGPLSLDPSSVKPVRSLKTQPGSVPHMFPSFFCLRDFTVIRYR